MHISPSSSKQPLNLCPNSCSNQKLDIENAKSKTQKILDLRPSSYINHEQGIKPSVNVKYSPIKDLKSYTFWVALAVAYIVPTLSIAYYFEE